MLKNPYFSPFSKKRLRKVESGLIGADEEHYPFLNVDVGDVNPIPVFIDEKMLSGGDKISQAMYKKDNAESAYENFLKWLFETFKEDEFSFRSSLIKKL